MCSRDELECMFGRHWFKLPDVAEEELEELLELANDEGEVDGLPHGGFMQACKDGDLNLLRSLGTRGCQHGSLWWQKFWREAVSEACQAGHIEVLTYLLDVSRVDPADLCPWSIGEPHRVQPESAYRRQPFDADYDATARDAEVYEAVEGYDGLTTSMMRQRNPVIERRRDAIRALETARSDAEKKRLQAVLTETDAQLSTFDSGEREPIPNPAPPLYIAAACGHCELVTCLIALGADPDQPAYDGTTPFYAACERSDMPMVRLLHGYSVNMAQADQDGTAPVHIAALSGHVDVLQFLYQHGISMTTRGTVYVNNFESALVNATPLEMAQYRNHMDAVNFLQPAAKSLVTEKRAQSDLSMEERALACSTRRSGRSPEANPA